MANTPPLVIAVASGKGGVGKTTTAANISVALGQMGMRVVAIDMDGQGNLGQALGVDPHEVRASTYHLMTGRLRQLDHAAGPSPYQNVSVVPARMELFGAEAELPVGERKEYILKALLQQQEASKFDVAIVDLPPNLGFHTINGLTAARWVLVPLQVSGFALTGLRQLAHAIRLVQDNLNPELELMGLVPTFVNARSKFSRELVEALEMIPNMRIFQPYVPYAVRVAEGSLTGVPVVVSSPESKAGAAYLQIAKEILGILTGAPQVAGQAAPRPGIPSPPPVVEIEPPRRRLGRLLSFLRR